eukprot:TRINITY_DN2689_c0_g1_i1.p2 TRINITY_DN2689_c0_g1~~TRINITY_DN2689_c0_g1_i1.p2  ORF type:complete len:106 (-),score=22.83 TRINITY_DN2689_c0_g1_i1:323-640(-)
MASAIVGAAASAVGGVVAANPITAGVCVVGLGAVSVATGVGPAAALGYMGFTSSGVAAGSSAAAAQAVAGNVVAGSAFAAAQGAAAAGTATWSTVAAGAAALGLR